MASFPSRPKKSSSQTSMLEGWRLMNQKHSSTSRVTRSNLMLGITSPVLEVDEVKSDTDGCGVAFEHSAKVLPTTHLQSIFSLPPWHLLLLSVHLPSTSPQPQPNSSNSDGVSTGGIYN